ncbi:unnamed protein product [Thelazia callipaeda]|uniref:G_PROTEIN_RECEP_F1_2 domain-containing protein n=1 Tax=Thelazia callipaeda TaxID=103827 RepID=A0A0N5CR57_THECL|nr:unnamed protein product [Thelazia callipaeda]
MEQADYDDYSVPECEIPENSDRRWYLVAIVGTPLSVISLFSNLLIARAVLPRKQSPFFFLGLLAFSDSFLSFCYGPVIAMDIIKNRVQWLWLNWMWWSYVGPLLALCHVSMTFSCFLIILNTIERYLITKQSNLLHKFRNNRCIAACAMFLFALVVRGSIIHKKNCTGLAEYEPTLTPLVTTWFYGTVFRFYFRNIVTVFIPFFLLAYLNIRIVLTLREQQRTASFFKFQSNEHKCKVRSATRLAVFVVCSYLMANVLNVLITAWEYIDFESAQTEEAFWIYETCTDVISVLYVLTCATRLLVYMSCNKEICNMILTTLKLNSRSFSS